jgi:hypothetical protein
MERAAQGAATGQKLVACRERRRFCKLGFSPYDRGLDAPHHQNFRVHSRLGFVVR